MNFISTLRFVGPRAANDSSFTPRHPALILCLVGAASATLAISACTTTPMNRDTLRHSAERSCRVQLTVSPEYGIGPFGAYSADEKMRRCMAARGFRG